MVQSAIHTTSKAQRAVVAATTTATAMIIPIVIVQTPVRASKGCLKSEVVGKRARMLIHLITQTHSHERAVPQLSFVAAHLIASSIPVHKSPSSFDSLAPHTTGRGFSHALSAVER